MKMSGKRVTKILEEQGRKAYEAARDTILREKLDYKPIHDALTYFMQESWYNFQHPALLSLACKSVGGNPDSTMLIGTSLVLLTGAADIHDDIIDQSKIKNGKPTVFGKFGRDLTLLVGDALLVKGYTLLSEACEGLPKKKKKTILNLVKGAFFEIGNAEAEETSLKGRLHINPEKYLAIMKRKAAIAEMTAQVGGILGDGSPEEIEALGEYGRVLGILGNIRHEFADVFDSEELKNRIKNECLPLPVLYAFRNRTVRKRIVPRLRKRELTSDEAFEIAQTIMVTKQVQDLKAIMNHLLKRGIATINEIKDPEVANTLNQLLYIMVKDL